MILKEKYKTYYCSLTEELDKCAEFNAKKCPYYKHYLLDYRNIDGFYNFPIRVPGRTIGGVWVDNHNVITNIKIDRSYAVKTYSNELDAIIEKYIGKKIELER